ncbi:MAG: carboxypeptidase M32 [Ktedonobacteraceae bacterium]|nr:carboxypeptidase M32 [Ktedonobacteraceae bacterium]
MTTVQQNMGNPVNMPDFTHSDIRIHELLILLKDIEALGALKELALWDQNTMLPEGAGAMRATQMAAIEGVLHERQTNPRLGALLSVLKDVVQDSTFTDADRGLVRAVLRSYDHSTKLPRELVEEIARVEAGSFEAWRLARAKRDFSIFAPWLTRTIALQGEVADRFGYSETRYDALLDLYEPRLTASRVDALFTSVREVCTKLLQRIQASGTTVDDTCLQAVYSAEQQVALCTEILKAIGYDFSRGGIAQSPHPFTAPLGAPFDVRVTIRTNEHLLQQSLMAAIHEGGHALYEQGSAATLASTPVAGGASMGMHESQSLLWEKTIGRSEPFWQGQFHLVQNAFPEQFAGVDAVTFARALNKVQPGLIRIEADEVTYNLHIIIRFELEKLMINGDIAVESLPRLWNEKYREYLGVEPDNDADGVLQDVHWTSGCGYFPTYTLGYLYAAQIFNTLHRELPHCDEALAQGDTAPIRTWLQEHMYSVGSMYQPEELIKRLTGEALNPAYFASYLNAKFARIFNLS